jgi:hypothetical protein
MRNHSLGPYGVQCNLTTVGKVCRAICELFLVDFGVLEIQEIQLSNKPPDIPGLFPTVVLNDEQSVETENAIVRVSVA